MLDDRNRACSCREGGLALQARARPLGGALQGALPDRVALAPHRQSRAVHHDEHVLEPAAGLAHQIRQRTLLLTEGEHAGRARVDAELVLDREAAHVVRAPSEPSAFTSTLGTTNSEMPLTPVGAPSMRASTMCSVLGVRS